MYIHTYPSYYLIGTSAANWIDMEETTCVMPTFGMQNLMLGLVRFCSGVTVSCLKARAGCSWTFLGLLFVPAILPHL